MASRSYILRILAISTILLGGCTINLGDMGKVAHERTIELSGRIEPQGKLKVRTDVGNVNVTGAPRQDWSATVWIVARAGNDEQARELADRTEVRVEGSGRDVVLRVINPKPLVNKSVSVAFDISAPMDISVDLATDVGDIRVQDITGSVTASTDVGNIHAAGLVGKADMHVDVGNVTLQYAGSAPSGVHAAAKTDVGNVSFSGPHALSARIDAGTDVGSIHTKIPVTVVGKLCKSRVNGTVGDGSGHVCLKTDVGSISIK